MKKLAPLLLLGLGLHACKSTEAKPEPSPGPSSQPAVAAKAPPPGLLGEAVDLDGGTVQASPPGPGLEVATFAGGCFWCMEPPFEKLDGVKSVESGFTGGAELRPSYKQVAYGKTGHTEAVRVVFDPKVVGYDKLLDTFWRSMDPTDAGGQFVDRGKQYRPAIFVHSPEQEKAAAESKAKLSAEGPFEAPIVVPIQPASAFWLAEEYHQDFYKKSTAHYKRYRSGSGRDGFLKRVWGE